MGTNNTNKNNKGSTDVIGVISALAGLATAATPLVANAINNAKNKSSEKTEEKIKIPELYHKGFPIDLEQAVRMLEDCGLKSSTSKLTIKEANPRYKDCFDSQVIGSNPKQGTVVKIGLLLKVKKYLTNCNATKKNLKNVLEKIFRLLRKGQNRA